MIVNLSQFFFHTPPDILEEFFRGSGKCIYAFWRNVKNLRFGPNGRSGRPGSAIRWILIGHSLRFGKFSIFSEHFGKMHLECTFGRNVKNLRFRPKRHSSGVSVSVRQHVSRLLEFLQKRATEKACRERAILPRGSLHRSLFFWIQILNQKWNSNIRYIQNF